MKKKLHLTVLASSLLIGASLITSCGSLPTPASIPSVTLEAVDSGVLTISVNPEIAIAYDADGLVTAVTARNPDAVELLKDYTGFEGKPCREVALELVELIGNAGYFIEEIEGDPKKITVEIEKGSFVPNKQFLDEIAADIRARVENTDWTGKVRIGISDYGITDYGTLPSDTTASAQVTDYGITDYGISDYGISDYYVDRPGTDVPTVDTSDRFVDKSDYGITDYNETDYNETDYGSTDYSNTDYENTDYGKSDYNDSDYGDSDYGDSDYGAR